MRPAVLLFSLAACLCAQPSGIEGVAVNAVTGQPLPGVHVRLCAGNIRSGFTSAYGAISGRAGHFSITGMPAGTYSLLPEARGFVYTGKSGSPIASVTLKPGEPLTGFKLEMTPRAVIRGRVLDENGDPVPNVSVQTESASGQPQGGGYSGSNDRGEFRISGPPGKYYVKAMPNRGITYSPYSGPEIRLDGSVPAVYAETYYPNGAGTAEAAVMDAAPGAEVTGIDIHLTRRQGALLKISGVVSGMPDGPVRANVRLTKVDTPRHSTSSNGRAAQPDGRFEFDQLEPAGYHLVAYYSSERVRLQSPAVDIKLDGASVANVELALAPPEELAGTVELAGEPPGSKLPGKPAVRLGPHEVLFGFAGSGGGEVGETGPDGAFSVSGVFPGKYRVGLDHLPENAYVQSVKLDGAAAPGHEVDLSHGVRGSRLTITVSLKGAQISGTLLDKDGRPAASPAGGVFLVESGKELSPGQMPEHFAQIEGDPKYILRAIPPGKYHLLAVDSTSSGGWEMLNKLLAKAEEVEIKEGDRINKDLKMAGTEDLNAKP